jgi:hypothetical protein
MSAKPVSHSTDRIGACGGLADLGRFNVDPDVPSMWVPDIRLRRWPGVMRVRFGSA